MRDENLQRAVLGRIAAYHNVEPARVSLGDRGAVFYHSGDGLLCLCQQGSHYWNEVEAAVIAEQLIERVARN